MESFKLYQIRIGSRSSRASMEQANVINKVLLDFCTWSRQKINKAKTQVFFSKNVSGPLKQRIGGALEFAVTDDFGKYLRVPLLHSRITKHTYNYILHKV
ncbi:conserved hypothetical protein [Ricinus communis]|uniref:Reverse transcriptase domain-containing protein n=1 Tax=Ricinus communis TaxID=3988 RepID=B9T7M0_RICCO|nr:conserved hypothetical protein [Ricinus communis]